MFHITLNHSTTSLYLQEIVGNKDGEIFPVAGEGAGGFSQGKKREKKNKEGKFFFKVFQKNNLHFVSFNGKMEREDFSVEGSLVSREKFLKIYQRKGCVPSCH